MPRTRPPHLRAASPVDRSERAMRQTLRIAPAGATKNTTQDAPGTTIGTWGDLRVYLISGSRMIDELFSASTISEPFRNIKEGVDADVPVDAQNASTATWKTADSFPQAPTPIIFLGGETRTEERPATKPTCYPCPRTVLLLMSPAAQIVQCGEPSFHATGDKTGTIWQRIEVDS